MVNMTKCIPGKNESLKTQQHRLQKVSIHCQGAQTFQIVHHLISSDSQSIRQEKQARFQQMLPISKPKYEQCTTQKY